MKCNGVMSEFWNRFSQYRTTCPDQRSNPTHGQSAFNTMCGFLEHSVNKNKYIYICGSASSDTHGWFPFAHSTPLPYDEWSERKEINRRYPAMVKMLIVPYHWLRTHIARRGYISPAENWYRPLFLNPDIKNNMSSLFPTVNLWVYIIYMYIRGGWQFSKHCQNLHIRPGTAGRDLASMYHHPPRLKRNCVSQGTYFVWFVLF